MHIHSPKTHWIPFNLRCRPLSLRVQLCLCMYSTGVELWWVLRDHNHEKPIENAWKPVKTHTFTIFTYFHSVHHVPLRFCPPLFHSSFVYMFPQLAQWQPTTKDISKVFWLWQKCEKISDTRAGYLFGVHRSVAHPPSREILSFSVCSTSWTKKKMSATRNHGLRKSKNTHSHSHATHVRRCFSLRVDLRDSSTTVPFHMYVCI